jgi:hypothetical protein
MSKTLNDISPDFRDYLLKRNLAFAKTIEDNSLSSRANGIGYPVNIDGDDIINPSPDFNGLNDGYRNNNLSNNQYNFEDGYGTAYGNSIASRNSDSVFSVSNLEAVKANLKYNPYTFDGNPIQVDLNNEIIQQRASQTSYFDSNGNLQNQDAGKIKDINTIVSLANGDGVGLDVDNTLIPNFDVRSSIIGRSLLEQSGINDTPLGQIQHISVTNIAKNRAIAGLKRETLGKLNLNPISLLQGNSLIRPSYDITVGGNMFSKLLNFVENVGGFEVPISKMSENSSIFHSGKNISIESLTNYQIKDTGRGQVDAMFSNLQENKYIPSYQDGKRSISEDARTYDDFYDDYKGLKPDNTSTYENINPRPDSLLDKTKFFLGVDKSKTLINSKGHVQTEPSEVSNSVNFNGTQIISKGSGVKSLDGLRGDVDPEKVFGRVFTVDSPYKHVYDLQKNKGLNQHHASDSVLGPNGFPNIAPTNGNDTNMKNFMFSLENLAWDGETDKLPQSEIGPGDPMNKVKGRIMWFPPYDINIDDSTSVNWNSEEFIGRGEPIYTYTNTERFGSLSFKMIIDYPSYLNELEDVSDDILNSMMSGVLDEDYIRNLSKQEMNEIKRKKVTPQTIMDDLAEVEPEDFEVYFAKGSTEFGEGGYESDGLNSHFTLDDENELLEKLTEECPSCVLTATGYYTEDEDFSVGFERQNNFITHLRNIGINNPIKRGLSPVKILCNGNNENSPCRVNGRRVYVKIQYTPSLSQRLEKLKTKQEPQPDAILNNVTLTEDVTKRFMNESKYFTKLKDTDPVVYDRIKDKIKYFHPAFHSMTPEGFNARLNFLQQCTRQGPTKNGNRADNMSFGRPPICILRLGDFYHTKIAIDTVNLTYEPLVWDLNPEGVGVQPMICTVQLSFKMIGGSSLKGPINKLLNAVSFNFFGNTEMYDPRAETLVKSGKDGTLKYGTTASITNESEKVNKPGAIDELERAKTIGTQSNKATNQNLIANLKIDNIVIGVDFISYQINKKNVSEEYTLTDTHKGTIQLGIPNREILANVMKVDITEETIGTTLSFDYDTSTITDSDLLILTANVGNYKFSGLK